MLKNTVYKKNLLLLFVLCTSWVTILAQQRTVTGKVTDTQGEAIVGATVMVRGMSQGTITDLEGKYSLQVPATARTLVISYVGMKPVEVNITSGVINISLEDDTRLLDDVVVVGYGTQRKRDLTGSISSVQGATLAQIPVTSTAQALAGRVPGMQITTADGSPDAEILIRVRGGGSITQDNSPLFIVDGFPASNINNISPTDIQSIDVLKDASATAIYGSQGANGVVIITTKSAQGGRTEVSYNGFLQTKQLSKRLEILNPYEYVMLNYEHAALSGSDALRSFEQRFGVFGDLDLYRSQRAIDWQQDMFGANVPSQQHNVSITGGNEKTKFSLSSTYNYDGGLMENNNYTRFTTNFKLQHEISKSLKMNFNIRLFDIEVNGSGSSGANYKVRTSQAVTSPAVRGLSALLVIDPALLTDEEYEQWLRANMTLSQQAQQFWKRRNEKIFSFLGSVDWNILKGLVFRTEGGYEYGFRDDQNYWGEYTTNASFVDGKPLVDWRNTNNVRARLSNTITYSGKINDIHQWNVLAGQELNHFNAYNTYLYATGFGTDLTPDIIFANLALGGATKNISSYFDEPVRSLSYFGRINYALQDKYLVTVTFRTDATSKFEKENRWAYFPAASAAWRMYQEDFMANTREWLSNLKLRVGYGVAGNSNVPAGLTRPSYRILSSKTYGLGDLQNNFWGTASDQLPNPKLQWETNYTHNAAIDFGVFDERINGTIEVYKNIAKDLLLTTPIVAPGYTRTTRNIGQTSNQGIEITLNASAIRKRDFTLTASFNIAFNKSNVDKLAEGMLLQEYASGWAGTDLKGFFDYHVKVGEPVGLIYGWVNDGYYTTNDFESFDAATNRYILKAGVPTIGMLGGRIGVRPGTAKFKDLNNDGVVNDSDREIIGRTPPKATGGFSLSGTWKNLDFLALFNFVYGNQVYNANKIVSAQQYRTSFPNMLAFMRQDNRYTYLNNETGTIVTDLATLAAMNEGENAKEYWSPFSFGNATVMPMSWAVEDGSFLRFQNLTVGYTLPKKISRVILADQLRFYGTLNNIFVLTNYSGYDPEVSTPARSSSTSGLTPGVDFSSYPKSFSWTLGVNVTF